LFLIVTGNPDRTQQERQPQVIIMSDAPTDAVMAGTAPAETALGQVLAFLLPFFLKGAAGDADLAHATALQMLDSFAVTSSKDLLLAAQIIAFSLSALDTLGTAVAVTDLSPSARLRLRGNANALHRAGEQCRKALDRSYQRGMPVAAAAAGLQPPTPDIPVQDVKTAMQKVRQAIVEAAPSLAQRLTDQTQPISRQERRYLARKAEERLLQQEREARKAARIKQLATTRALTSPSSQPLIAAADRMSP